MLTMDLTLFGGQFRVWDFMRSSMQLLEPDRRDLPEALMLTARVISTLDELEQRSRI